MLAPFDLAIVRTTATFDSRLVSEHHVDAMCASLASPIEEWLTAQRFYEPQEELVAASAVRWFYDAYLGSVFRKSAGGSGFNNLLWLYIIARSYRPSVIVDSGTFTGASAWALRLGAPEARLLSFDIDLSRLKSRVDGVEYIEKDWAQFDFSGVDLTRSLAYFDDHVDQAKRLIESQERGVSIALFDDDYTVYNFAEMAHGGFSLPKVEFVTDASLRGQTSIQYIEQGKDREWKIDSDYLDRAARTIERIERLPNTSEIAGHSQLPYRIVSIAK